jgi:hypothetical protein
VPTAFRRGGLPVIGSDFGTSVDKSLGTCGKGNRIIERCCGLKCLADAVKLDHPWGSCSNCPIYERRARW